MSASIETDFNIIFDQQDSMALILDLTYYKGSRWNLFRASKPVKISFTADQELDKSVIIYACPDGRFLIDEPLNDEFHTGTNYTNGPRLAWFNIPAAFNGNINELDIFIVNGVD